jgi:hypothetical protein
MFHHVNTIETVDGFDYRQKLLDVFDEVGPRVDRFRVLELEIAKVLLGFVDSTSSSWVGEIAKPADEFNS